MNSEPPRSRRRCRSNPSPTPFIPDDLIVEIISWLTVKPLMKMKCVSKSYKDLISDPKFVKLHLNRSSRNTLSYLVSYKDDDDSKKDDYNFVPLSIADLHDNPSKYARLASPYYCLTDKDCRKVVGSCNGLVCLLGSSEHHTWFRLWNPATRTISDKLGFIHNDMYMKDWKFTFGYDNSHDTYKVVALLPGNHLLKTEARVLSFGDNNWRNIQSFTGFTGFTGLPLQLLYPETSREFSCVHLNCTVNWVAIDIGRLVIISLDLGTETYKKLRTPPYSLAASYVFPHVCVLKDNLCFYHDINGTDFFLWTMTKFGDDKSWTKQVLLSRNNNLRLNIKHDYTSFNLYLNGDILVFIQDGGAVLVNLRNGTELKSINVKKICWLSMSNYVESLVSTC